MRALQPQSCVQVYKGCIVVSQAFVDAAAVIQDINVSRLQVTGLVDMIQSLLPVVQVCLLSPQLKEALGVILSSTLLCNCI